MSNKFTIAKTSWGHKYFFWCIACDTHHIFDVRSDGKRPNWSFNGDLNNPTFSPSLLYPERKCHLFLENGKIKYLSDCSHKLAGQTVDMVPVPNPGELTYEDC